MSNSASRPTSHEDIVNFTGGTVRYQFTAPVQGQDYDSIVSDIAAVVHTLLIPRVNALLTSPATTDGPVTDIAELEVSFTGGSKGKVKLRVKVFLKQQVGTGALYASINRSFQESHLLAEAVENPAGQTRTLIDAIEEQHAKDDAYAAVMNDDTLLQEFTAVAPEYMMCSEPESLTAIGRLLNEYRADKSMVTVLDADPEAFANYRAGTSGLMGHGLPGITASDLEAFYAGTPLFGGNVDEQFGRHHEEYLEPNGIPANEYTIGNTIPNPKAASHRDTSDQEVYPEGDYRFGLPVDPTNRTPLIDSVPKFFVRPRRDMPGKVTPLIDSVPESFIRRSRDTARPSDIPPLGDIDTGRRLR